MNQFTLSDVADKIHTDFGLSVPKSVIRKLLRHHFKFIMKVIRSKKDRILMRETEVHTIYTEPKLEEIYGSLADVDETRILQDPNVTSKSKKFKMTVKAHKLFEQKRKRHYKMPKLNA